MNEEDIAQSVLKAASMLKSFTPDKLELSIGQMSKTAGIPKTTARRMVVTLARAGLLEQDPTSGKYKIGPALYMQGTLYLQATETLAEVRGVASVLGELTGETITASLFDKDKLSVTYILVHDSIHPLRWDIQIGKSIPAHASAMGRAFLSELDDAEIDELFPSEQLAPVTRTSIASRAELKKEIALIRQTGISYDRERYAEGLEGFASLVRDASGRTAAGMVIVALTQRMNKTKRAQYAKLIKSGTGLASYRLGHYDPTNTIHTIEELRTWWQQNQMAPTATVGSVF